MLIVFVKQNAIDVSGLLCSYFSQSLYTYKPTANIHSRCFAPKSNQVVSFEITDVITELQKL